MATDEEYLDNLLKSMTDNKATQSKPIDDAFGDFNSFGGSDNMSDLSGVNDLTDSSTFFGNDVLAEDDIFSGKDASSSSDDDWMNDLSKLLGQEDQSDIAQSMEEIDKINFENLIDKLGDGDDELEEINGLLMNSDQDGADDDMLALLEGIDSSGDQEDSLEVFNALDELAAEDDSEITKETIEESTKEEPEEKTPDKEQKKRAKKEKQEKKKAEKKKPEKKKKLFGRKKRAEQTEEEAVIPTEMVVPFEVAESVIEREKKAAEEAQDMEGITEEETKEEIDGQPEPEIEEEAVLETNEDEILEETQVPKEKKKGFFARLITALVSEDETENLSEENKEILNELAEEDKKKKENKKKEKKEKKEKKSKKEVKKKPPKKPKKTKAEKVKNDVPPERPGKPISMKTWLVLVAFCATILGSVILLSFFLPEYADKMSARSAFSAGDYETVYTLLYDKNLISSDELIFNRAKTIRIIERRVEAYENRIALGKELEALDSLFKGVKCYQTLTEADEYGVRQEVDAIYQQICSILENNYGITVDEAMEINSYDSEAYTRRLQSVVSGDSYEESGEELKPAESAQPDQEIVPEDTAPEDILPEEEEIMNN